MRRNLRKQWKRSFRLGSFVLGFGLALVLNFGVAKVVPKVRDLVDAQSQPPNAIAHIWSHRSLGNPLITPASSSTLGTLISSPSVIRVPAWVREPLGKYYMYFSHHGGQYIRLAYADNLHGPWQVYEPGSLKLSDAASFYSHIATPDVHVDKKEQRIIMYFHSKAKGMGKDQWTGVAVSEDGIHFSASDEAIGLYSFRVFSYGDEYFALAKARGLKGGRLYRSPDRLERFSQRDGAFIERLRRSAVLVKDDTLIVFYSLIGDAPESILASTVDLRQDWNRWTPSEPLTVLEPETEYEGGAFPTRPSVRGRAVDVREVREPFVFEEEGKLYLFYSISGEKGIAMAELELLMKETTGSEQFAEK